MWDLSAYDGVEIDVKAADGKIYTLVLKDEELQDKRDDGRERAGINWEVEFRVPKSEENKIAGGRKVWVPWSALKATYRGKEKEDAGELKTSEIRRVGFMMRRYVFPHRPIPSTLTGLRIAILAPSKEILDWSYDPYARSNNLRRLPMLNMSITSSSVGSANLFFCLCFCFWYADDLSQVNPRTFPTDLPKGEEQRSLPAAYLAFLWYNSLPSIPQPSNLLAFPSQLLCLKSSAL